MGIIMTNGAKVKMMLEKIRRVIAACNAPEKMVMEALCGEAEGWEMRLAELEDDDGD